MRLALRCAPRPHEKKYSEFEQSILVRHRGNARGFPYVVDSVLDEQLTFRFLSALKINPTGKPWSGARVTVAKSPFYSLTGIAVTIAREGDLLLF